LKNKGIVGYKWVDLLKIRIGVVGKAMKIIMVKGEKIDVRSINYTVGVDGKIYVGLFKKLYDGDWGLGIGD